MVITTVSELLAVKIVSAAQAVELFQLKGTAELQRLTQARNALIEQARAEVQAPPDHVFNPETRTFQPKSGPVALSTNRATEGAE